MSTTAQQEFGVATHYRHGTLIEVVTEFSWRVQYIQQAKPPNERAERVRLFQMFPDNLLPPAVQAALIPARDAWAKLNLLDTDHEAKRNLLDDDYKAKLKLLVSAAVANMPALEALHKQLCKDCPWDGKTIFPKKAL